VAQSSSLGAKAKYFRDKLVNAGKFREFGNIGFCLNNILYTSPERLRGVKV
jgi:hypothetical protein